MKTRQNCCQNMKNSLPGSRVHAILLKPLNEPKAFSWKELNQNLNAVHYGCQKLPNTENYLSIYPSALTVGELALKNYELWKIEEPYTLASNYISPFELG